MDTLQVITQELGVQKWQVEAAVKLIDEGNTIPFISRYRKEATGTLNDEQLRNLNERLTYLRNLEDKKNQVLSSIEDQGKLRYLPIGNLYRNSHLASVALTGSCVNTILKVTSSIIFCRFFH